MCPMFYMETVGNSLLRRDERRDEQINEWMVHDEVKDDQIASARLPEKHYFVSVKKTSLYPSGSLRTNSL